MSPRVQDVKVVKSKRYKDKWEVIGGGDVLVTQSHAWAKEVAGARRRVIIKHALRNVGIKTMPRSLTKQAKRSR